MPLMPSSDPLPAQLERIIESLRREVRALQASVDEDFNPGLVRDNALFSYHGVPVAADESGGYLVTMTDGAIQRIDFTARVAGTAGSTLSIRVNGTEVYACAVPANVTQHVDDGLFIEVEEYDKVSVAFTAVASGLDSVVVNLHIMATDDKD